MPDESGKTAMTWLLLTAAPAGAASAAVAPSAAAAEMTTRARLRAVRVLAKLLSIRFSPSRGRGVNPPRHSGPVRNPEPVPFMHGCTPVARTPLSSDWRTRRAASGRFTRARRVARCHGRADRDRYVELGGPGVRRGVVSAGPARPRPPALVRRALRGGRGELDVLRCAGREDGLAL